MAAKSGLDIITALKFLKLRDLKQRAALTAYLVRRVGLLPHIDKWDFKTLFPKALHTVPSLQTRRVENGDIDFAFKGDSLSAREKALHLQGT